MDNKNVQVIPDSVLTQVKDLITQANSLLLQYVVPLTPEQRRNLAKMGEKTLSFVEKAFEFAAQNPNLCPPYLNMEDFGADFNNAHKLFTLVLVAQQLMQFLDDTEMAAGSEAYSQALVFYNSVKIASRHDVPGAKAVYDELKKRFPGGKRKSSESEAEMLTEALKSEVSAV